MNHDKLSIARTANLSETYSSWQLIPSMKNQDKHLQLPLLCGKSSHVFTQLNKCVLHVQSSLVINKLFWFMTAQTKRHQCNSECMSRVQTHI